MQLIGVARLHQMCYPKAKQIFYTHIRYKTFRFSLFYIWANSIEGLFLFKKILA